MNLGSHGVFLFTEGMRAETLIKTAQRLEELGYDAVWFPEATGREPFSTASLLLSQTRRLIVATGIMNIHVRDAMVMAQGQQTLTEMSRGRFLLGLGVSHKPLVVPRGHDYGSPIKMMRDYLGALRSAHPHISILRNNLIGVHGDEILSSTPAATSGLMRAEVGEMPVVLAALGPKMTALAREEAQGAHPYNTTPEHTAVAREILGSEPWLCVPQRVCLTKDPSRAREIGRSVMQIYTAFPNYRNNWKRMGFNDNDMDPVMSDRLVDAMLAWGNENTIERRVNEQLAAGASQVCLQPIDPEDPALPCWRALEALAPRP